jgi:hypothetical protein
MRKKKLYKIDKLVDELLTFEFGGCRLPIESSILSTAPIPGSLRLSKSSPPRGDLGVLRTIVLPYCSHVARWIESHVK